MPNSFTLPQLPAFSDPMGGAQQVSEGTQTHTSCPARVLATLPQSPCSCTTGKTHTFSEGAAVIPRHNCKDYTQASPNLKIMGHTTCARLWPPARLIHELTFAISLQRGGTTLPVTGHSPVHSTLQSPKHSMLVPSHICDATTPCSFQLQLILNP